MEWGTISLEQVIQLIVWWFQVISIIQVRDVRPWIGQALGMEKSRRQKSYLEGRIYLTWWFTWLGIWSEREREESGIFPRSLDPKTGLKYSNCNPFFIRMGTRHLVWRAIRTQAVRKYEVRLKNIEGKRTCPVRYLYFFLSLSPSPFLCLFLLCFSLSTPLPKLDTLSFKRTHSIFVAKKILSLHIPNGF